MFCEYCGGLITKETKICPKCGKPAGGSVRLEAFREGKGFEINTKTAEEAADRLKRDPIPPRRTETAPPVRPQGGMPDHTRELEELRRTNTKLRSELEASRKQMFEEAKTAAEQNKRTKLFFGIGMLALLAIAAAVILLMKMGSDGRIKELEEKVGSLELSLTPAPTEAPTSTPAPTPAPTETPAPTATLTPTPEETLASTITVTAEPTPAVTVQPTPEATPAPSAAVTMEPTPTAVSEQPTDTDVAEPMGQASGEEEPNLSSGEQTSPENGAVQEIVPSEGRDSSDPRSILANPPGKVI